MTGGWVSVIPDRDAVGDTAQALLALARDPSDVRTARGGREFLVPQYLADAYSAPAPARTPRRRRSQKEEGDE